MTITKDMDYTMADVKVGDVISFIDGSEYPIVEVNETKSGKSINLRISDSNMASGQRDWSDKAMRKTTLLFQDRIA